MLITDNVVSDALVNQYPSGEKPASLAKDGDITTCSKTKGMYITFQVELQKTSIVKGMYINFGGMVIEYPYNNVQFLAVYLDKETLY